MSVEKAVEQLRCALGLCGKVLNGETDPETISAISVVVGELETVIQMLEEHRSAIPLNDNGPAR